MRHNNVRRSRHRHSNQHSNQPRKFQNPKTMVYDSNGPDVRIRGTAYQIVEKYQALAKDAASSGDRVLSENYLQHAEHYQRQINSWAEEFGHHPQGAGGSEQPAADGGRYPLSDMRSDDQPYASERAGAASDADTADDDLGLPPSLLSGPSVTSTRPAPAVAADNDDDR